LEKKLLFKIWKFPQLSETFILAQIITAIKCGYKVNILVEDLLDIEESKQQGLIEKYKILDKIIIENYQIPKNKLRRFLKACFLVCINLPYFIKLIKYLLNEKILSISVVYRFQFYKQFKDYDIIHVQYGTNVKPIDVLKKTGLISSKLVVSFHGHDAFFPINGIIPNNGYYENLFKYGDLIVANTPYLAGIIEELGCPKNKLETIPVGVDTTFFHPIKNENKPNTTLKLISVGRLDKVKGHIYLIEVIDLLYKKGYSILLTIVGEGIERENIENLIAEKKLEDIVTLKGKKNQQEVKYYLREHDIYILAAVPVENKRRETQGLATLEAQACGLPAVVFDSGGVKYTVSDGKTGFIVPEFDVDAMTLRIEELIDNVRLRQVMGREASIYIENHFSQKKINDIWCYTYNILIE